MRIRKVKYTIPQTAVWSLRGRVVYVPMPYVLAKGNDFARVVYNSKGEIVDDALYLVNPNVKGFIDLHYGDYDSMKDANYLPREGKKEEKSYVGGFVFKGDTNYYSQCSVKDYISKCNTGKPARTLKETWASLPVPIAFNTKGADKVVVSRVGRELTFEAQGDMTLIYNFIPNKTYTCRVMCGDRVVSEETFTPTGEIRQIYLENTHNVRDIGLKKCYDDNGRCIGEIDCGRYYRGKSLANATSATMRTLTCVMGVDVVLDISRENNEKLTGVENLLGTTYGWGEDNIYVSAVTDKSVMAIIKKDIEVIADRLSKGKNIYVHCEGGMDRTGIISYLIESVCGCTYDDMWHDYEISALTYSGGLDDKTGTPCRIDVPTKLLYVVKYLHDNYGKNGETPRAQAARWLTEKVGVAQSAIDAIRNALIV